MNTLDFIVNKFGLILGGKSPIEILKVNRTIMAVTLCELGFKRGAEIGTAQGEHAETLCKNNPGLHLICIDPWVGYRGYTDYLDKRLKSFYEDAKKRLAPYDCELVRKFSEAAAKDYPDESLDFVYIDGAHDLLNVVRDMTLWLPKVKPGGVFFGHDYKRSTNPKAHQHVVEAVNAFTYAHHIDLWFTLGERGKHDGLYREGTRSWMWVKT